MLTLTHLIIFGQNYRNFPLLKNQNALYLDKIENLAWVYKECFGTICDEYSMQNFVIEFGLKKCGLEALIEIARSHKSLDFYEKLEKNDEVQTNDEETKTADKKPDVYKGFDAKQKRKNELEIKTFYEKRLFRKWQEIRGCVELEIQDSEIQVSENRAIQESESKHDDQVPLPENGQACEQTTEHIFNVDELEVLRARSRLLHYQKMLDVYLDILGGKDSRYDKKYFYSVRDKSGLDWAIEIAQGANSYSFGEKYSVDWQLALRIIFERFWPEIKCSYHFVLKNISETEEPESFKSLLPSAGDALVPIEAFDLDEFSDEVVIDLGVDWVFKKPFNQEQFTDSKITGSVQNTDSKVFYEQRALDIEEFSRRADYSKEFLKIALENGVDINKTLWRNFQCLSLLVYQETNFVRFSELKKMAASDKVNMLVSKLEPDSEFIEEFYQRLEISTNEASNGAQNLDKLGVEYFSSQKNTAFSEAYLQKLVLFSENLKIQESTCFQEAGSLLKEVIYSLDECKQFELETLENLVKLVDEFDTWRHFEIFKILRNYEMPLSLERIKFGKSDLLLARIMRGVINKITKKATILDMASKLHSKFNNTDQNLRILDGIFAKLEELDFNINKAISGLLNDDDINQGLLTQFFSDEKYHTDIIQNLVVESGVGFIDKAESIHDSAVAIAISRFKMFPRNQTSIEYLDFISGIKIVEKTCNWNTKIQNHYKFLRDVRMVKDRLDFIKNVVDDRIHDENQFSELLSCARLLGIHEARLKLFLANLIEKDGAEDFGLKITLELTKDAENEELSSKEVKQVAEMCLKFHDAECARFALENADEDTILEALDTFETGRKQNDSYFEQLKEFESEDPFWTTLMYRVVL